MSDVTPTKVYCRKCGAEAGPPIYSEEYYGGRPALFWACTAKPERCEYTWTLLIYGTPEHEIGLLRHRVTDLERELSGEEPRP